MNRTLFWGAELSRNKLKAVIYSGGRLKANHRLHQALSDLVGEKRRKSFTYIPFMSEESEYYYRRSIRRYRPFGFTDFHCLRVDQPQISESDVKRAINSDVIYLAGGNTFYFLMHLQRSGMLPLLRKYALAGGVLAGLSAGGILMTPHIGLAGYPRFDCDENDVGLTQLGSLGLVNFEFFPHYRSYARLNGALKRYSQTSQAPIIACEDGGGLVINGDQKTFVGKSCLFINGQRHQI